ncbi:MAG: diaminopimelate decarboxylase [Ruminococcaceae bacterium]|nr:diaminopimelate decarboxylase [Oscillospiraceae bacterium]
MLTSDCLGINEEGHLTIGGVDTLYLAEKYGTPLYVMSEDKIREIAKSYLGSIKKNYNGNGVPIYASKAFCCKEICRIIDSEGLDMDSVSAGEIYTAIKAGVDPKKLHFHGNNKTYGELEYAIENGVGDIIADNFEDIIRVNEIGEKLSKVVDITLRIKPGIDVHTHEFIRTGQIDSKFGFALENGEAEKAAQMASQLKNINLNGVHCHIGSQIFDAEPFVFASEVMLGFIKLIKDKFGIEIKNLNLGGGFGIKYLESDPFLKYEVYMESVSKAIHNKCAEYGLNIPKIFIEPGRSVIGEAGITLYTVGNVKEIENVRNYISVDGGMGDNPRYALYQAEYTCVIANRMNDKADYKATIAGKYCESGDLIQENVSIVKPEAGEILAVLSTGAYNYSMASNYNRNVRPACVMIKEGQDRLIIRRETFEDLIKNDI